MTSDQQKKAEYNYDSIFKNKRTTLIFIIMIHTNGNHKISSDKVTVGFQEKRGSIVAYTSAGTRVIFNIT